MFIVTPENNKHRKQEWFLNFHTSPDSEILEQWFTDSLKSYVH